MDDVNSSSQNHYDNGNENADDFETKLSNSNGVANGDHIKPPKLQKGVLRTNCIDCLDRTNVAQYAYGLAALGQQLHALGAISTPKVDLDAPIADDLMKFYERMGDTLAHQYGGSAAHNKVLYLLNIPCCQILVSSLPLFLTTEHEYKCVEVRLGMFYLRDYFIGTIDIPVQDYKGF